MRSIFRIAAAVTVGASALLLSGCVVAPAYPGYGYGYGGGYGGGYYEAAPVVVSPSVGFFGSWGGGGGRYGGGRYGGGRYWR
ncbi:hypothetical protein [Xylophilus sp. GOD-11R]|uniref:hypothetical protein n=1 Tax=Xylophilus sp. GOD-11R TaxID=3089814 RepID=UPI00298BF1A9|nr:hypothetical protein [Xylophilus sp. GOD-11R]WPB54932.1 hypothetical protein R9X41_12180 [Xylophilus sp. GOD-11R]